MTTDQPGAARAMADEIERLMALAPDSCSFTMKGTREELSVILAALRTSWIETGGNGRAAHPHQVHESPCVPPDANSSLT